MKNDASELYIDNNAPAFWDNWIGGGIKNNVNARGNVSSLSVFKLKSSSIVPDRNMGKESIWYSNGWKVYEPYSFIINDNKHNIIPVILFKTTLFLCEDVSTMIAAIILYLIRYNMNNIRKGMDIMCEVISLFNTSLNNIIKSCQ